MANNRELSQFGSFIGVNDGNKKITIGSTTEILGDGYVSGNLGVGTADPQTKVEVNGIIGFTDGNIKIGDNTTGCSIVGGNNNNFIGVGAGSSVTTGSYNNFIGSGSGKYNQTGSYNDFIGCGAGRDNTTGSWNTFIGYRAGINNISGETNTFVGYNAGQLNTSGCYNAFFGRRAGDGNTTGNSNSAFGRCAGSPNDTGGCNVFLGSYAGNSTSANYNIILGVGNTNTQFGAPIQNGDKQLAIGLNTESYSDSKYWIVGNENFNVGIGTTNPETKLHVDDGVVRVGVITEAYWLTYELKFNGEYPGAIGITTDGTNILPGTESFAAYPETGYRITTSSGVGTVTEIAYSIAGAVGIASTIPTIGNDDGYWELTSPFDIQYVGVTTNVIVISTNSTIGFAPGVYGNANSAPNEASINISGGDRRAQILYTNTNGVAPNRTFFVRFVGSSTYEWDPFTEENEINDFLWEATFYENAPSQIDIQIERNPVLSYIKSPKVKLQLEGPLGFSGGNIKIGDDQTGRKSIDPFNASSNVYVGLGAGELNDNGCFNVFLGLKAGGSNSSGCYNNFFGYFAGYNNSTGDANNFLGTYAGINNEYGSNNNFLGYWAGSSNRGGSDNNFLGRWAGSHNFNSSFNNFIGYCAGYRHKIGDSNNFIGSQAGRNHVDGTGNNFLGDQAGFYSTSGSYNNIFGISAGYGNTGSNNNIIGSGAGYCNAADENNFIGLNAGRYTVTGTKNNFIGSYAGYRNTTGSNNNYMGVGAGYTNTTGSRNNFFGCNAGAATTNGSSNNFFGAYSGQCSTTGNGNNFIGECAGRLNIASYNNFLGFRAGAGNTTGNNNNFLGPYAGQNNRGNNNNFFGYQAGFNNCGSYNVIFGYQSGFDNCAGGNTFIGHQAGRYNTTGGANQFIGFTAGLRNTIGSGNNFIGAGAGRTNTSGCHNHFIGYYAGSSNTTGNYNLFFGFNAGNANQTGSFNVVIGKERQLPISNGSNQLVIGSGSNDWIVGNSSYFVGIGTTNPTSRLHVVGNTTVSGVTTSGRFISTAANNTADAGGQIYLNGASGNRIEFNANGTAAPSFTTRSLGTKITFFPQISAVESDYAMGVDASTLWRTIPQAVGSLQHRWYGGITQLMDLKGSGELIIGTSSTTSTANQKLQVSSGAYISGSVGIGTTNPTTNKVQIVGGDLRVGLNTSDGLVLTSPNGTRFRLWVTDVGILSTRQL